MPTREYYESLLDNPNVQRGLALIRYTEGTAKYPDPYGIAFGGRKFDYSGGHPGTLFDFSTKGGKRQKTSAHGAYQFLGKTWNSTASRLGLENMSPRNQDIAALALIDGRGGLDALKKGDLDTFVKRAGPEWASLPTAPKSYDQPTKSWDKVRSFWDSATQSEVARLPDQGPIPTARPESILSAPMVAEAPRDTMGSGILSGQFAVQPNDFNPVGTARATDLPGNAGLLNYQREMGVGVPEMSMDARNIAFTPPDYPVTLAPDRPMPSGPLPTPQRAPTPEPSPAMPQTGFMNPDYQQQPFSTAPRRVDAYGLPPIPGLQPVAVTPEQQPMAQVGQTAAPVPVWDQQFPEAPKPSLGQRIKQNAIPMGLAVGGGMLAGPVGALAGGWLGKKAQERGLLSMPDMGGILGNFGQNRPMPEPFFFNGGYNPAISGFVQSGYAPAGAAYRDSAGGWSMSLGGGQSDRTNRYGVTTRTLEDGRQADVIGGGGLFDRMFG